MFAWFSWQSSFALHQEIASTEVTMMGTVVRPKSQNHADVHNQYTVRDLLYTYVHPGGPGTISFADLRVGQPVPVTYNPTNMDTAMLDSASAAAQHDRVGAVLGDAE
jgi:hypothetical protein